MSSGARLFHGASSHLSRYQAHNNWVQIKKRAVKPKPFEGKPIQVKGIGRVKAVPNIAVINGEIEAEAEADDEAVDTAAKIINAVQEALSDLSKFDGRVINSGFSCKFFTSIMQ